MAERTTQTESHESQKQRYQLIINAVGNYFDSQNIQHAFVGGTVANLIGENTTAIVDVQNKSITLQNGENPSMIRENGTVRDLDILIFTKEEDALTKSRQAIGDLAEESQAQGLAYPPISIEAAYQPDWNRKRNRWTQLVTMEEFDLLGNLFLTYGHTKQQVDHDTLQTWTYNTNGLSVRSFPPGALWRRYTFRVASGVKSKDKAKVEQLKRFDDQTKDEVPIDYSSWDSYADKLFNHADPLTKFIKSPFTKIWWSISWLGESATQGVGIFKFASKWNDRMG